MKAKRTSPAWWIAGIFFALAAIACRFAYDGPTDAWLVILSYFFAVSAVAGFAIYAMGYAARRRG